MKNSFRYPERYAIRGMDNQKNIYELLGQMQINSERWRGNTIRCHPKRLCKSMRCGRCVRIRRQSFLHNGESYVVLHNLRAFVTVGFPDDGTDWVWHILFKCFSSIWKKYYRHPAPKYVRCLAIGRKDEKPHVHILMTDIEAVKFQRVASQNPDFQIHVESVTEIPSLLGYFFDQNYLATYLREDRPRGIRLLVASRGLRVGFPKQEKING